MPADFSFQLYPDDLERLEWYLNDAVARVPILGTAGLSKVINGPIPYAPDGNPLIGPMPGVPNAFEACVFTFGIAQAGGAGKVLAEWVTQGATEWDMWTAIAPLHRFLRRSVLSVAKGKENYATKTPSVPAPCLSAARDSKLSHSTYRLKRSARSSTPTWLGARDMVRAGGRRRFGSLHPDLLAVRSVGAAHPRRMPCHA